MLTRPSARSDSDGAIVATLEDYRHAHEAFDEGLATVHGKVGEKVTAVVAAIEAIKAATSPDPPMARSYDDPPPAVKVTLRDLAQRLRVASYATAAARLETALALGLIEQDEAKSGPGGARWYRILRTEAEIKEAPGLRVFPRWRRCARVSMTPSLPCCTTVQSVQSVQERRAKQKTRSRAAPTCRRMRKNSSADEGMISDDAQTERAGALNCTKVNKGTHAQPNSCPQLYKVQFRNPRISRQIGRRPSFVLFVQFNQRGGGSGIRNAHACAGPRNGLRPVAQFISVI